MLEVALKQLKEISINQAIDIEFNVFALNKEKTESQIERIGIKANVLPCLEVKDLVIPGGKIGDIKFCHLLETNLQNIINDDHYYLGIQQCDALFFIGGGYFNSYWGDRLIPTFILPLALGYQLNKPIFISGVNLGPFHDKQIKNYYGLFKKVHTLILRDRTPSLETLEALGGTNGNLILGADDILPRWYCNNQARSPLFKYNHEYAVIQLHHWVEKYSSNYIEFYKTLAKFINNLLNNGVIEKIYFTPFTYFKGADYECGRRLKTFLDERDEYVVLKPTNDHVFMRELISGAQFLIASRYHPIVFGLGEQIPTMGIAVNDLYRQKIAGAYDVIGVNKKPNIVDINEFSEQCLIKWYASIRTDPDNKYIDVERIKAIDLYADRRQKSIEAFLTETLKRNIEVSL